MCLFLIVSFGLVGYTMALSVFLAAIGGVACGLVINWWNNDEISENAEEKVSEPAQENQLRLFMPKLPEKPESKAKSPNTKSPNKTTANAVTLFDWLFRKKG
ncbi:hypothetical protein BCD67_03670 [Oscillatoriales cyanobacterium USR001]|nr:hypothetical protein BCD67_03670 [Oscillatoriales cyanobacterium USR001]